MSRICFYTKPFPGTRSYFDMIDLTVRYGLTWLEGFNQFEFSEPDLEAAKRVRAYADEKGVRFCCFSVYCNLTGEGAKETVRKLKGYAEVAQILGSPYLHHTVVPEFDDPRRVLPYREQLLAQGIEGVREVFDHAQKHGVLTVFEDQGYAVNGVQGFGEFLERVDRPVGVVADFGNICQVGEKIADFIRAFRERIVHVHLKDLVYKPCNSPEDPFQTSDGRRFEMTGLGAGCVELENGITLLRQAGYDGCYAMEFGAGSDDSSEMREAVDQIRRWLA